MIVVASGWMRRIALTIVNPSPGESMLRSEIRTENFSVVVGLSDSETLAATVISKPDCSRIAGKVSLMPGSSSTKRILGLAMLDLDSMARGIQDRTTSSSPREMRVGGSLFVRKLPVASCWFLSQARTKSNISHGSNGWYGSDG